MIELYLSKVSETSQSELAGKIYARVDYKQELSVQDMAKHMAEHNTSFSEGTITGILIDFVKCIAQADKVAQASIGTLKDGDKTGPVVKVIKLLAQSTGDFTREELKKDVKFSFTDKTKDAIAAAKGETAGTTGGGSSNTNPTNGGGDNGGNSGGGDNGGGESGADQN